MLIVILLSLAVLLGPSGAYAQAPGIVVRASSFEFAKVVQGEQVEHAFVIRNDGDAPVRIQGIRMTPPLTLGPMPAQIAPGAEAALRVRLDTRKVLGDFEGDIEVVLSDPAQSVLAFRLEGRVVGTIEVAPFAAFFVAGPRGRGATGSIEIVNHGQEPLRILGVDHSSQRFSIAVTPVEEGKRYRLTLTLAPDGPGGRLAEPVVVRTSSAAQPELKIVANTYLRERVYTFPDALDFGSVPLSFIRANAARVVQTLMVYRLDTTGFEASFSSDAPLSIAAERGPNGDRVQATVALRPDMLAPGPLSGTITVTTNDPAFPTLRVPFTINVLP